MLTFETIASSSAGCCYIVSDGSNPPLMIDCGLPISAIRKALPYPLSRVAAVLVSHLHQDHCKSANDMMRAGVDVFASRPTIDAIKPERLYCAHELTAGRWAAVGRWQILPFEVEHDCDGAFGFVVASPDGDRLLYLTDTCFSRYAFTGLTHIAAECNHSEMILRDNVDAGVISTERFGRTYKTHLSLERLCEFLRACDLSKVQRIWLLHLSDSNSSEELFKATVERTTGIPVEIAQKG